ncbi:hypothetical protein, variant [Verruconis gallopava]|uniref:Uncharacterized protein n=1 Tax=Verruconis gallopava TaxID=253628 RepID=A0A0D2A4T3_9PEZI|nr:hypothetical protein, variant [Verruconis gallopava]KIW01480.1 hypothetical protein, variant [Verruconis gallopava]
MASNMSSKQEVVTAKAPQMDQSKFPFSQAISYGGMIYCSGNIGINPETKAMVPGSITDRTIQALTNLSHILEAGGSSLKNVVKVNVFITTMDDFDAMNKGYLQFFEKPLPV